MSENLLLNGMGVRLGASDFSSSEFKPEGFKLEFKDKKKPQNVLSSNNVTLPEPFSETKFKASSDNHRFRLLEEGLALRNQESSYILFDGVSEPVPLKSHSSKILIF